MKGAAFGIILSLIPLSSMQQTALIWLAGITKLIRISCVLYHGKNHDLKLMRLVVILLRVMESGLMQIDSQPFSTNCRDME
ncbi:Uncharacterised protein [Klebsiella pneumoniae]|nr:Uncharacterised protein [Klebsiella pneumoniae]